MEVELRDIPGKGLGMDPWSERVALEAGEVALSGRAEELRANPRVVEAYLGAAREVEGG